MAKAKKATRTAARGRGAEMNQPANRPKGELREAPVVVYGPRGVVEEHTVARSEAGLRAEEERRQLSQRQIDAANAKAEEEATEREQERQARPPRTTGPVKEFVLLSGDFQDERGNLYTYDRNSEVVVLSPYDLDSTFPNKFRRKEGNTSPGRDFRDVFDRPGLMDAPLAETRPDGVKTQFSIDAKEAEELKKLRAENARLKEQLGIDDEDDEEEPVPERGTEDEDVDEDDD